MAIDFASRDFDTIKSDLLSRAARVLPEWTDRDPSDFGMLLIDLWAQAADVLHYYIDRTANEAFLPTAQQRESVLAVANLLDYTPRGRESATGTVTVLNSSAVNVNIPRYTEFVARYNDTSYSLFASTDVTATANTTTIVPVTEGRLVIEEVLPASNDSRSAQRYSLIEPNVADSTVRVFVYENGVDPTEYQRIGRMTSALPGDRVFVLSTTADGATEVVFGTSLNGMIPPTGAKITATYAVSSGVDGNLPSLVYPHITFKAASPVGVDVQSLDGTFGGLNEESIESLKASIPSVISAQNRAVTRNDFVALALQVPGVAKASVEFEPNIGPTGNSTVTIYPAVPIADSVYLDSTNIVDAIPAALQTNVVNSIQPKALLGVDVVCATQASYTLIDLQVTVYVADRSVAVYVKRDVEAAIDELFKFDNVFFGQRLTLSQLYRLILNVPGVDYVEVDLFDEQGGAAVESSILIDPLKLPKKGATLVTTVGGITTAS